MILDTISVAFTHVVSSPDKVDVPTCHSGKVCVDPDNQLSVSDRALFQALNAEYDEVFNPVYSGYNGAVGQFQAVVNMGPVLPPQRKGRVPQYARDKLVELQQKFDDLEAIGVFSKPEDVGVVAEYLNPSFLVKKPNGSFRLVTAFSDVGRYSKPQPALLPDVESTLRSIGAWKYIIVSDLTSAFYQIPLSKDSMKYCGVATPFKGVRVYTRCAMGMPGSETALEELMCRVLGDLVQEGIVAKIADDLYCGGNTVAELLQNWRRVLGALHTCGLGLSASKTKIVPKTTTILGWVWSQGSLHASPHRIATLSTCSLPVTVTAMRSFIGAFKILSRVLPHCAHLISPLDNSIAGKQSQDHIDWTDDLRDAFKTAQRALSQNRSVILPKPDDQLWIVTDGATKTGGLGATLYATRDGKLRLAGFFSAKLRKQQIDWIPCEVEALCIATALKHFSPYVTQSLHHACILTDSKPCVQAYEKLCRGEFSSSARVSTFLSIVSRFQASVRHLAGSVNLPSDFASRNAPDCLVEGCQICSFIARLEDSTVRSVNVRDVVSGVVKLPFTSRPAWKSIQSECADLRRARAHLTQGTHPSKKETKIKDVKRYINVVSVAKDGLLVVKRDQPLIPTRECIVVPRQVLAGLLTALHIKLDHPTNYQLQQVVKRYFFALDVDRCISDVTFSCHQCASLRLVPHNVIPQSMSDPPAAIGISFAADVIKRERQLIFVLRETVTSFTVACLIENERHETLHSALIRLCIELRPMDGPIAVIRTDPAPGFVSLVNDEQLHRHRLCVEIGRVKNCNKNPVAEKAVQEVVAELLRQEPAGGPVSSLGLSISIARLNSRVRSDGLSAREMWTQRDQFTNDQLPLVDRQMILSKHRHRTANHVHSELSKAPRGKYPSVAPVSVGDIVYIYSDRNKSSARDRYLVTTVDGNWCSVRKFAGSQLRSTSYRVKLSECYKVKCDSNLTHRLGHDDCDDSGSDVEVPINDLPEPPVLPQVPNEIVVPFEVRHYDQPDHSPAPVPNEITVPSEVGHDDQMDYDNREVAGVSPAQLETPEVQPRRSTRQKRLPRHFEDYVMLNP